MNVGGPARHVIRIDAPLRALGYRSLLVTGRPEPGEGDLVDEARAAGLEVVVLEGLGRRPRPGADLRTLAALRTLVATRRPALVHTHAAKAGTLGRLAALAAGRRPALVHTFHGHVLDGYFGALASGGYRRIERLLARRTERLVAVSAAVRDELLLRHGVGDAARFVVVPPGFDPERSRPDPAGGARLRSRLGCGPDDVLVACVARLAPVKNVSLLLRAWERARVEAPSLRLVVVGDGPEASRLRAGAARLPGVRFLEPRRELGDVYAAADLFALSSDREGCPQVLVEALAAGLPVVATAVGGVPALLRNGELGRLVPPGDEAALAAVLVGLARDGRERAALAARARAADLGAHAASEVAAALARTYAEALELAGAARQTAAACTSSS